MGITLTQGQTPRIIEGLVKLKGIGLGIRPLNYPYGILFELDESYDILLDDTPRKGQNELFVPDRVRERVGNDQSALIQSVRYVKPGSDSAYIWRDIGFVGEVNLTQGAFWTNDNPAGLGPRSFEPRDANDLRRMLNEATRVIWAKVIAQRNEMQ